MRKPVFSREDIVTAAVAVVARDGLEQLSARRVAEELGSSTAPVYSNFANMEELVTAAKEEAVRVLLVLMRQDHTPNQLLNMGVGVLKFVWDSPRLYSAIIMQPPDGGYDPNAALMTACAGMLADIPELAELEPVERVLILKKLAIFTNGLAADIIRGCDDGCDLDALILLQREVGQAVVELAYRGSVRSPAEEETLRNLQVRCGPMNQVCNPNHEDGQKS